MKRIFLLFSIFTNSYLILCSSCFCEYFLVWLKWTWKATMTARTLTTQTLTAQTMAAQTMAAQMSTFHTHTTILLQHRFITSCFQENGALKRSGRHVVFWCCSVCAYLWLAFELNVRKQSCSFERFDFWTFCVIVHVGDGPAWSELLFTDTHTSKCSNVMINFEINSSLGRSAGFITGSRAHIPTFMLHLVEHSKICILRNGGYLVFDHNSLRTRVSRFRLSTLRDKSAHTHTHAHTGPCSYMPTISVYIVTRFGDQTSNTVSVGTDSFVKGRKPFDYFGAAV